ncbi:ArsR family transcriptional regulator [Candidatus Woesearchaeota archaeon]|nr:MAG: ArsR family transcriptional regulator [Candidatus Woesearchaeota archaeon]
MAFMKITIYRTEKPKTRNINEELQWFGQSIGLFSLRDKDKSCFRIFIVLVKNMKTGLTSDELADNLHLTRGTVVHHLNKLIDSGIVVSEKGKYVMRAERLSELIALMKKHAETSFKELEQIAKEIDERLEL